jgi:hypothetical protein
VHLQRSFEFKPALHMNTQLACVCAYTAAAPDFAMTRLELLQTRCLQAVHKARAKGVVPAALVLACSRSATL